MADSTSSSTSMSPWGILIEVCVDSVESAKAAVAGGANRLEVCANLTIGGGTTPSVGLVVAIARAVPNVPLMIMLRPRVGDFVYTPDEISVIHSDIEHFSRLGVMEIKGFVCGVLLPDATVDVSRTSELVKAVVKKRKMDFCFHRAFDMVPDQIHAYNALASLGITRILTSGGEPFLTSPRALTSLVALFDHRSTLELASSSSSQDPDALPTILIGSGINSRSIHTILSILHSVWLQEVHMSGSRWIEGSTDVAARKASMGFGSAGEGQGEWGVRRTDASEVFAVREQIDAMLRCFEE